MAIAPTSDTSSDKADRIDREKAFHDDRFSDDTLRQTATSKFYEANRASADYYRERLLDIEPPAHVLEYGCGIGSSAFELAALGATVVGIDISPVAIQVAEDHAAKLGCSDNTEFVEADAEATGLLASSFDLICGSGILHHLDLDRSNQELHRLLKPEGRGVFLEPLGHNPAINWYRDRTPEMRTVDEHPLLDTDFSDMEECFTVETSFFGLATLATTVTKKVPVVASSIGSALTKLDQRLLQIPAVQKHAWTVVVELRPR